jgi:hypothetical protein
MEIVEDPRIGIKDDNMGRALSPRFYSRYSLRVGHLSFLPDMKKYLRTFYSLRAGNCEESWNVWR